jgi:N-acetylglutamate synthase-like GNAT family acetyltransferase
MELAFERKQIYELTVTKQKWKEAIDSLESSRACNSGTLSHDYSQLASIRRSDALLLRLNGRAIGTVRLDEFGNGTGAVRLVAIEPEFQRQSHGRVLSDFIENYARRLGILTLYVNAVPEAVGYYRKLGWMPEIWDEAELVGIASECLQMSKKLI